MNRQGVPARIREILREARLTKTRVIYEGANKRRREEEEKEAAKAERIAYSILESPRIRRANGGRMSPAKREMRCGGAKEDLSSKRGRDERGHDDKPGPFRAFLPASIPALNMKDFGFLQTPYETTTTSSTPIGRPREILHSSAEVPYRAGSIGGALAGNRSEQKRQTQGKPWDVRNQSQNSPVAPFHILPLVDAGASSPKLVTFCSRRTSSKGTDIHLHLTTASPTNYLAPSSPPLDSDPDKSHAPKGRQITGPKACINRAGLVCFDPS
ncbi:uncharacterized protein CIMG_13402 [Coccidioides immitis RS]|uniref:Uncharacterized protein n=1 Tax=Coccidioides immitis (strain RS) TaxID=246410 RepID=J3KEG3_COCIM|nr:uncharacterized protein CIMG_13402 [Coccidioides immitis RS]EAS33879.3 hypothetical protein CIMG_13402 [Coccidioides immitis RS]